MANDTQNLMNILGSLTGRQISELMGALKKVKTRGMDVFEKARKSAIDSFFNAQKVHHDTYVNPDYTYEFQEFPCIKYSVERTDKGLETIWMQFEGPDETENLGPEWQPNPGAAMRYFKSLTEEDEPQPEHKRRGRPPLKTGDMAHA